MLSQKSILGSVRRELDLFINFTKRDWSASFIPSMIVSIGALRTLPSTTSALPRYPFLLLWTALYMYFFDLLNQIIGVIEDRINKPDRPIPSGKVTVEGAKIRCIVVLAAFLSLSFYYDPSILPETITWVLDTAFLCLTPAGQHWVGKDCIGMTAGSWSLLSASWKIIAPPTMESQRSFCAIALWVGFVMNLQDLRDVKGDVLIGRKTMPLVMGEWAARSTITFVFLPLGFAMLFLGNVAQIAPLSLFAVHIYLGWRVMRRTQNAEYDHMTYTIFIWILCLILICVSGRNPGFHIR